MRARRARHAGARRARTATLRLRRPRPPADDARAPRAQGADAADRARPRLAPPSDRRAGRSPGSRSTPTATASSPGTARAAGSPSRDSSSSTSTPARSCSGRASSRGCPSGPRRRPPARSSPPTSGATSRSSSRRRRRSRRAPRITTRSTSTRGTRHRAHQPRPPPPRRGQPRRRRGPLPRGAPPRSRRARSRGTTWACCCEDAARPDEALAAYERAVRADPALADAHYNLALLYERAAAGRTRSATSRSTAASCLAALMAATGRTARAPRVLVGTSGFSYPAWRGHFYPEDLPPRDMLAFYARAARDRRDQQHLLPPADRRRCSTGWARQVPAAFRFALKAPQRITHQLRLRDAGELTAALHGRSPAGSARSAVRSSSSSRPTSASMPSVSAPSWPRCRRDWRRPSSSASETWFDDETYGAPRAPPRRPLHRGRGGARDAGRGDGALRLPAAPARRLHRGRPRRVGGPGAASSARWKRAYVYFKHEDEARGTAWRAPSARASPDRAVRRRSDVRRARPSSSAPGPGDTRARRADSDAPAR